MSSVLDMLNIDELNTRKKNLLIHIDRIDNELKKRGVNVQQEKNILPETKIKIIIKKKDK
jgi:hypothetical protein